MRRVGALGGAGEQQPAGSTALDEVAEERGAVVGHAVQVVDDDQHGTVPEPGERLRGGVEQLEPADVGVGIGGRHEPGERPGCQGREGLQPGEVSDPIKQANAYYIFRLEEFVSPPFEEVKDDVYNAIQKERFDAWMNEVRKDAGLEIKDEKYFSTPGPG